MKAMKAIAINCRGCMKARKCRGFMKAIKCRGFMKQ